MWQVVTLRAFSSVNLFLSNKNFVPLFKNPRNAPPRSKLQKEVCHATNDTASSGQPKSDVMQDMTKDRNDRP